MNLEHLKTFYEVIKTGSYTEAAGKLSITQPAVSFQIHKLEQDLGARLIERGKKGVIVTAAGKRLLRFAEAVTRERTRLTHDLDQIRENITGDLSITASNIPGIYMLPALLSEFKLLHPVVSIHVTVSDSGAVLESVSGDTREIGFCGIKPVNRSLESFKIAEDEIVLITHPGHPFTGRKSISITELSGEPLIFREASSGTRRTVESHLIKSGFDINRCEPSLILGTTEAVVSAVEAGAGIAFVSNLAIKKSLALGLVRIIHVQELNLRRNFFCVYRKKKTTSRLIDEFVTFIRARGPLSL